MADLIRDRDRATGDLVELRLDLVDTPDVQAALHGRKKPVIVTCRAAWEGGGFSGSEDDRLDLLAEAVAFGAEFVDIEARADRRRFPSLGNTRLIVSFHDFSGFPVDLESRLASMRSSPHEIVKVAVTATRLSDCVRLRDLMKSDLPHIAIAMGGAGQLTRLFPVAFGSFLTFGGKTAPGQVSAAELRDVYRVHEQTSATALYGVAGFPLKHSASPAMHNPALAESGIDGVYVPFETADAAELLAVADAFGVQGLSITAPLKTDAYARVGSTDPVAKATGAINTLKRGPDGWEGRNFDVAGFLSPFDRARRDLSGQQAVVLGAGGAARTAIWALASRGAQVSVSARDAVKAQALATEFGADLGPWPPSPGWDLLVNTTPVGTWPAVRATPIDPALARGGCVYDLVYNPPDTALLEAARASGADTIGGLEMLVGQACLQFEWWTGARAPREIMHRAAEAFVARAQAQ
jgi:3-dehydroquinate dehydratase/shikimate dehydrogenase